MTPSHHRVHHAINPEYIDKNFSQIFIVWDKIFGTFQKELKNVKPIYGIVRPAGTWNPIIINFKHFWQLLKYAWHAEKLLDKIRIWFMPTGWRPKDVIKKYPINTIVNPLEQIKYSTKNSIWIIGWSWVQLGFSNLFMIHLFFIISLFDQILVIIYGAFIITHIFSFTSVLDQKKYAVGVEMIKCVLAIFLLWQQNLSLFGFEGIIVLGFIFYLFLSFIITIIFIQKQKQLFSSIVST